MNQDLERLIALQLRDTEGRRLRDELTDAPKRVATAEAALKRTQAAVAANEDSLRREELGRRSAENDVRERTGKIARLGKQMETATSAAQITALEHEIEFARAAIGRLEDDQLVSMERTETLEAALAAAQTEVTGATEHLSRQRERAARVQVENTAELQATETARAGLRHTTDETRLAQYDRIAKARGTAVSEGVDGKCAACQMMVRPQRWNELTDRMNADAVFTCESCGRFLYYDPRRDTPTSWKPGQTSSPAGGTR